MSRRCELTGKGPMTGHKVSHAQNKTKRRFLPNLQKKRFYMPELDKWITLKVSAKAIRTISKHGVYDYVKKLHAKGEALHIKL